jgi:agmatine/peptidylarginine deiminase
VPDPADPGKFRDRHAALYRVTVAPPGPVRLVAEFEPAEALYLAWEPGLGDEEHLGIIRAVLTHTRVEPVLIHNGPAERDALEDMLVLRAVDPGRVVFVDARALGPWYRPAPDPEEPRAVQTPWLRDWGPLYIETRRGLAIVDPRYWADRPNDDALPTKLARLEGKAVYRPPLALDGGNLLTDGAGTCFMADGGETDDRESSSMDVTDESLRNFFGCRKVIWLAPLAGEETGHVDMFLKVGDDGTLLVGHYLPDQDPENSQLLDENAAILRLARGADGRRYRVLRVPMPDNSDGIFRTFLNAAVIDKLVLYPTFPGAEDLEPAVRHAFAAAFRGRKAVGLVVEELMSVGGAIHCATRPRPRAPRRRSSRRRPPRRS